MRWNLYVEEPDARSTMTIGEIEAYLKWKKNDREYTYRVIV